MKQKIHMRDTRLLVNAGLNFPLCYANARLLDLDKGTLSMTAMPPRVDCKRCLKIMEKRYSCKTL